MSSSDDDLLQSFASLPTMAHPTVSPQGDAVAMYYDVTGRNEVQVLDVDSGELLQWSDGQVPRNARWYLTWDPTGENVLFHQDESGNEQNDIYSLSADGTVDQIVSMSGQATVHDVGETGLLFGSSRDGQMNLFWHEFETDETTKLTEYDRAVWGSILGPTGDRIAYSTNETDTFENRDVYVANADGTDARNLEVGAVGGESFPVDWGPDGERLLVADNTPDFGRAGIYHLDSDEVTWFGEGTAEEFPVSFLENASKILTTRDREAGTIPIVYDVASGETRELSVPDGVANFGMAPPFDVTLADGRIVFTLTTPTRRPELVAYDLETDDLEVLIEAEYGDFDRSDFTDVEYFTVASDGVPATPARAVEIDPGTELDIGALLFDVGRRPSPLVVKVHGGPRARDAKRFDSYTQLLTLNGYSVLQVNYRGSTGRGREFVEELIEDWGGREQGDVATVLEEACDQHDWIDEDRIAVFGGSFGGYSANWQLLQYPDLYAAGVAWIGVTDLEDMYENTMPHYKTELMEKYLGTPEENPELYRERSPVTHADNLDAPLLLVHGVNDRRVPVSQARILQETLESAGYEEGPDQAFEYEELGEEGHASTDQEQKLRMYRLVIDFLDRRL